MLSRLTIKWTVLVLFGLWVTTAASPLMGQQSFSEADWERAIEDLDYSKDLAIEEEVKEAEEVPEEPEQNQNPWSWLNFDPGFGQTLARGLLIGLGIVLLVLLIRYFLKADLNRAIQTRKESRDATVVSVADLEENLEAHDPTSLIDQAIEAENYRLAVRLYYLKLIRELSLREQIRWQPDKTNRAYLQELKEAIIYTDFRALTRTFEWIWYGNRSLEKAAFEDIQQQFERLLIRIQRTA